MGVIPRLTTSLERAAGLFRRHRDRYKLDPLALAAVAYQESRLDQSMRSAAGAIGVMQTKPEIAADPIIAVVDLDALEDNVHAGTKQLAFLRHRDFSDPAIPRREHNLLLFAACNAGPARVGQRREEAAHNGLDPNRWFGNVEVVAARRIGRETVQYVGNSAKYNVACHLATAEQDARSTASGG